MQIPPPFEYERATSIDHAIALLERLGPEARLVAGGHSLLPMMKLRLARPEHLIDINDLDLAYVRVEGNEIQIGAMTRHRELLESAVAGEHYAIFAEAERVIADPIVRNRGTVGGSLCQADPSEDLSAVMSASARRSCCTPRMANDVPAREFHLGQYRPQLDPVRSSPRSGHPSAIRPEARTRRSNAAPATWRSLRRVVRHHERRRRPRLRHRSDCGRRRALLRARGRGRAARQPAVGREDRRSGTARRRCKQSDK